MKEKQDGITVKKADDFSEWYTQAVIKSEFVDYTSVSGGLAFRPDGYFAWEAIQRATDALFKEAGIQNVYFPMFIPERLLAKEKEHVEGFNPEVAWVTHTGDSKLDERLAVRPTSETIMYDSYSKWVRSWRDLPMRYNQWNSVVRWEFKHPTPLLRSREFLWNEGHTAFATREEADAERDVILGIYQRILREFLALPGVVGRKTDYEKFAGAEATFSIEHMLPDGKVVQGPDFHSDGQKFAHAFEIKFIDRSGKTEYAYQNTFAISTRELGVMVGVHGDDRGLVMPPRIARVQVVIVPIYNSETMESVLKEAEVLRKRLEGKFRVIVDSRDVYSPGWKFNEWELRGVPIRMELGARELAERKVVLARRDTGEKIGVALGEADAVVGRMLDEIGESMYKRAADFLAKHTHKVKDYAALKDVVEKGAGFAQAHWCGSHDCEAKIKEETGAKASNMPLDAQRGAEGGRCVYCGKPAAHVVNFARSY